MKEFHVRKPIRLQTYDYSQSGYYFVTICTKNRENLFGNITNCEMMLNKLGEIVDCVWNDLKNHNKNIAMDVHCMMPNHVHGILGIVGNGSKPFLENTEHGIPEIIRQFKTFSSRYANDYLKRNGLEPFPTMWQKSYHDHIIRGEADYLRILQYIDENAAKWQDDCYYMKN